MTAARAQNTPAQATMLKVAVFDSDMLNDEKEGIKRLAAAFKTIQAES